MDSSSVACPFPSQKRRKRAPWRPPCPPRVMCPPPWSGSGAGSSTFHLLAVELGGLGEEEEQPVHDDFESHSSAACTSLCVAKVAGRSRAPALSIHGGRHLELKLIFPALHHRARPPHHRAVPMLTSHINPLSGRAALVGRLAHPLRQCSSPVAQTHQLPPLSALWLLDPPRLAFKTPLSTYLHAPPHLPPSASQKRLPNRGWVQSTA